MRSANLKRMFSLLSFLAHWAHSRAPNGTAFRSPYWGLCLTYGQHASPVPSRRGRRKNASDRGADNDMIQHYNRARALLGLSPVSIDIATSPLSGTSSSFGVFRNLNPERLNCRIACSLSARALITSGRWRLNWRRG